MSFPILSTLIFLPLISSFFILLSKDRTSNNSSIYISLFSSFATFLLSLFLWYSLDLNTSEFQFVEEKSWINNFIKFKLGVDGISILFIVLTTFITPILVSIAIPISYYLYILNPKILDDFKKTNSPLYNFLLNKWYIDELYEKLFVEPSKKIGSFFWKNGDIGVIDKFGPNGISKLVKIISNKTGRLQTGFIYDYAFVMLLGLSILLTYLILK